MMKLCSVCNTSVDDLKANVIDTIEDITMNNRVQIIIIKIVDLSSRLGSYYGLVVLFGYVALFAETAIQMYHSYLHVANVNSKHEVSIHALVLSSMIMVRNLMAIVALPYVCEEVAIESKTLVDSLTKLSLKTDSWKWLPNLMLSIKFSAAGFFDIDYRMLFRVSLIPVEIKQ